MQEEGGDIDLKPT